MVVEKKYKREKGKLLVQCQGSVFEVSVTLVTNYNCGW